MTTGDRDLFLRVSATGAPSLQEIFDKLQAIGGASNYTKEHLTLFEQALAHAAFSTRDFNAALEAINRNEARAAAALERRRKELERLAEAEKRAGEAAAKRGIAGLSSLGNLSGIIPGGAGPIGSAVTGLTSALGVAGPIGLGATAFAALSAGIVKAANSLGDYAREQVNVAARTGLSTTETQLFGRVAEVAGVNAGSLTTAMRTLSKAINENSEEGKKGKAALRELGLGADVAFDPPRIALEKIFEALGRVNNAFERDRLAIALLGRGGLELAPLFGSFSDLERAVTGTGVVISKEGIEKAAAYQREIKLIGLEWDALVNKLKEKAIGVVKVVVETAKSAKDGNLGDAGGIGGFLSTSAIAGNVYEELFRQGTNNPSQAFKRIDQAQRPENTIAPFINQQTSRGLPSGTSENLRQQAQQLDALRDQLATPKERLEKQLKAAQAEKESAEQRFAVEPIVDKQSSERREIIAANTKLRAIQAQIEALKDGKRASEETLRLQEALIAAQEKEYFGALRITAEYDKQLLRLKDKKENTPENRALAAEIRDVNLDKNSKLTDRARQEDARKLQESQLEGEQQRIRADAARQARITEQQFAQRDDEKGGAEAEYKGRIEAARQEFEFAKRRAEVERVTAVRTQIDRPGDVAGLLGRLTTAQLIEDKARDAFNREADAARENRIIRIGALGAKDRKEAEQDSQRAIEYARELEQLEISRSRTIAEGQSQLAVTNADPGFQLQARLNQDARRLLDDQREAAKQAAENQAAILAKRAEAAADPGKRRELEIEISKLEQQGKTDAFKIETDIIRARFDAEEQIAQKRKADESTFRADAVGFLNAAREGHGQEFARNIGLGILSTIEGNVAGIAFKAIQPQQNAISRQWSGTQDNPTFIGRLLAGTPFGPVATNPIKAQADAVKLEVDAHGRTQTALDKLRETVAAKEFTGPSQATTFETLPKPVVDANTSTTQANTDALDRLASADRTIGRALPNATATGALPPTGATPSFLAPLATTTAAPPDQTFAILGKPQIPVIPEIPAQSFAITGTHEPPRIPPLADQSFDITGNPQLTDTSAVVHQFRQKLLDTYKQITSPEPAAAAPQVRAETRITHTPIAFGQRLGDADALFDPGAKRISTEFGATDNSAQARVIQAHEETHAAIERLGETGQRQLLDQSFGAKQTQDMIAALLKAQPGYAAEQHSELSTEVVARIIAGSKQQYAEIGLTPTQGKESTATLLSTVNQSDPKLAAILARLNQLPNAPETPGGQPSIRPSLRAPFEDQSTGNAFSDKAQPSPLNTDAYTAFLDANTRATALDTAASDRLAAIIGQTAAALATSATAPGTTAVGAPAQTPLTQAITADTSAVANLASTESAIATGKPLPSGETAVQSAGTPTTARPTDSGLTTALKTAVSLGAVAGVGTAIASQAGGSNNALNAVVASVKPLSGSIAALSTALTPRAPANTPPSITAQELSALGLTTPVTTTLNPDAPSITARELQTLGLSKPIGGSTADVPQAQRETLSNTGFSGVLAGLGHTGDIRGIATGISTAADGTSETLSTAERIGAAGGTIGIAAQGIQQASRDFSKGGARGTIGGIGDVAQTAAALDPEPISKAILEGVALASKVTVALLGDPVAERKRQIERELATNVYQAPVAQNRREDQFGNYSDFDKYGHLQSSNFSAIPQIAEPFITRRNGQYFDVPGQTIAPYGGPGVGAPAPTPQPAPPAQYTVNINAIDGQSVANWARNNAADVNDLIHTGLSQASGPAQQTIRDTAGL